MSRVVMVVGGTSGIGLATAEQLVQAGDHVVVVARDEQRVRDVAAALAGRAGPASASGVVADVTDEASVRAAVTTCLAEQGRLDAVVLTAQVMAYGTVEEVPADVFGHVIDTGLRGTVHVAQAVLPHFREHGGALVVVSSLLAQIAVPSMSSYCTAKWGQLGLVRSLQNELRGVPGVSVSLVLPGAVDTPVYEQSASYAGRAGHAPPPVVGPDRVARACVRAIDHPRRQVHVGPGNRLTLLGFRVLPGVYDRLAPVLVDRVALRGPRVEPHPGNVWRARPEKEAVRGGWSFLGRRGR
ncbi:Sepiapterin reductase [Nocardioides dokdonensis FR1436]|uniref:Sepiapterin reductase n=1 Tax=Nocardioides dokdonensis FR1436 TaxID=1300347 RepID=A0A1A9GI18_9ACTN|nr:SDR family NAD(P)-dependent oxidoreductase [Nocardioides dokdonensis]ANH37884.1 Sepiapterin reductase [Nocardioides dokdonensis FR1436]